MSSREVALKTETTPSTCRHCGAPARLHWEVVRHDSGRHLERRLTLVECYNPECHGATG
jgi:hypothetical protein